MDIRDSGLTTTIYKVSAYTGSVLGSLCATLIEQTTKATTVTLGVVREMNSAFIAEVAPVYKESKKTIENEFSQIVK